VVLKHVAKILNGKFHFGDKSKLEYDTHRYEGKTVELTIKEFKPKRSNQLNQYYWGVVIRLVSDYTGFSKEETHELLKFKFLKHKVLVGDEWYDTTKSTTKLNNQEMIGYIEKIQQFAAEEFYIYIPDPNERKV
jgi:hypothetical protein